MEEGTWVKRKGHGMCFNLKTARTNHTVQLTHIGGLLGQRERRKVLAASLKKWQGREGKGELVELAFQGDLAHSHKDLRTMI